MSVSAYNLLVLPTENVFEDVFYRDTCFFVVNKN